ncbi:TrkA-N domain dehydrogenase [Ophiobolus disseminans]|uniref:TrkA-N domain dehydrogenase n=1 Tax=Ophiobolus disseminans TaxID=1469910 RepID=A0A6A6ZKN2_9PLEO|nr:TrkA-N domain dehydrogenase [Ophiobolus disseminans]
MSASKRILMIGGSGRTGKLVVAEALSHKHTVTALVRKPESMTAETQSGLITVAGTPLNIQDVRRAFAQSQPDVIIVTLSAPRASDSPFAAVISPPRLMADSVSNVVAVMRENPNVKSKIVIMQAFGAETSWQNLHCVMQLLMKKSNMIYQYVDHDAVAKETRASGQTYVFVRPSRLVEGTSEKVREWDNDGKGVPMMAGITRESVAKFLVECAERRQWDNSAPVIAN